MSKQTVEQRYKQQLMNKKIESKQLAEMNSATEQQKSTQRLFNAIKQSLQEAHQSVRQAQTENPNQSSLVITDQRLTNATQLIAQLQTVAPDLANSLPKEVAQQLKQLDYDIEKASGTLQFIQQSMSNN